MVDPRLKVTLNELRSKVLDYLLDNDIPMTQLANEANLAPVTVMRFINDKKVPTLKTRLKLIEIVMDL